MLDLLVLALALVGAIVLSRHPRVQRWAKPAPDSVPERPPAPVDWRRYERPTFLRRGRRSRPRERRPRPGRNAPPTEAKRPAPTGPSPERT
jgi:hypothetical protein